MSDPLTSLTLRDPFDLVWLRHRRNEQGRLRNEQGDSASVCSWQSQTTT
jgi:hypothetical protein